jgi:uncharacterized protein
MRFEWDEAKNRANQRKHGISFLTALRVFDDPLIVSRIDRIIDNEVRFQTFGEVGGFRIIMVAHTDRDEAGEEVVRIISARTATRMERRTYETENG